MPQLPSNPAKVIESLSRVVRADNQAGPTQHGASCSKDIALAINLDDLDRIPPELRSKMLANRIDLREAIRFGDEVGVAFCCDLLPAAVICDKVRSDDSSVGDYPTRLYLKRSGWTKVHPTAVLTVIVSGRVALNPEIFGGDKVSLGAPPPMKRVL